LNSFSDFAPNKTYPNLDETYEKSKRETIINLNNSLVFTHGENATIFAYIQEKAIFFVNIHNNI